MRGLRPEDVPVRASEDGSRIAPDLFARFSSPETAFRPKVIWFFNALPTPDQTCRQLGHMKAARLGGPAVFAYPGLEGGYLTEDWFRTIAIAVEEANRLDLDVWILDEGAYPSGFADGNVTDAFPQFRSKVLRIAHEAIVAEGEAFTWVAGNEPVVGIVASRHSPPSAGQLERPPCTPPAAAHGHGNRLTPDSGQDLTGLLQDGEIRWQPSDGSWHVQVFIQRLESYPCRSVSGGGPKDRTHSLPDYLKREATERFLDVTHRAYEQHLGQYFGHTVKGFFGDEPCLPKTPWTDDFLQVFHERKGYDLRPHLAALSGGPHSDREGIVYDYFEVLVDLWDARFYQPQTDWCAQRGMTYACHLCGEEQMTTLIHSHNSDFFGSLRGVGEPGIDVIWRQIHYGCQTDFPKLGGSAASVWGKPRAMTESFAVYGTGTTFEQMKYVSDYQLVRGINDFFLMMWNYHAEGRTRTFHPPDFCPDSPLYPHLGEYADYVARACLTMATGVPVADVAVYYPTRSAWIGDAEGLEVAHRLGRSLLEHQRDFEWVDDNGLIECCGIVPGGLRNRSGTVHRAFLLPPTLVIDAEAGDRLADFVRAGGLLICVVSTPARFGGHCQRKTRLGALLDQIRAKPREWVCDGKGQAVLVPEEAETMAFLERVQAPRVTVVPETPTLRLAGRSHGRVQVWFATNEGEEALETQLSFSRDEDVEEWDPEQGTCLPIGRIAAGTQLRLRLLPRQSRVLVLGTRPENAQQGEAGSNTFPSIAAVRASHDVEPQELTSLCALDGDWQWTFADADPGAADHKGPLALWSEVGRPEYSGDVLYEKTVDITAIPGQRQILDLGDVGYVATVEVNGQRAGKRLWPPYALDLTGYLQEGANTFRIRVTNTPANRLFARPEDRAAWEEAGHFAGSYVKQYGPFEQDSLPSGLLGPVRVLAVRGRQTG